MGGGGAGGGGGIGWVGHGQGIIGAYFARRRAQKQVLDATEAMMNESHVPIPPKPLSQAQVFWIGFTCGLLLGLFAGLVFWELT
jgi:hypothetical protein